MLKKPKKSIDEIIPKSDTNNTFESADKKEQEHKELKEVVETIVQSTKKAGRPMIGKSPTRHKIAFYVNDEQLEYLESLTNRKERTPNAVAKRIVLNAFELHNKD